MIKASPLLFIGLLLFLWGRGMTHEDTLKLGMGKSGHLEMRSGAAAVSVSASQGLHKLGKWFSFEFNSRAVLAEDSKHVGFKASFKRAFDWELRIPLLGVMVVIMFGLFIFLRWLRQR